MNPLKALTNLRAALAPKRCGATLWSVERGHRAAGFRERFHGRFGYPFNRPTIEREKFYGDRSRKTTFFWTMFFRRLEMSWSSPWEPEDA